MRPIRLVPDNSSIPFLSFHKPAFAVSGLLVVAALMLLFAHGLNFGIDFRGGTLIEIKTIDGPADMAALRETLGDINIGDVEIQEFGAPDEILIRIEQQPGGEEEQQAVISRVKEVLGTGVEYRRVEIVGPKVSGELVNTGIIAVLAAMVAVMIYIWFRFEWQFAVGAIIALAHDVILTLGVFSSFDLEFNLSIIAAIMTIVGYSLNDTVVVYDRVRENLRRYKKLPLVELLDMSMNQTLSRTVLTSFTTLLALIALYTFGGEVIRGFTFAMIWGVGVGTYSSIFVAAPALVYLGIKRDWSGNKETASETA
ncbi:MAG: protein translocase subunit SecF [Fimbriimonadaceae bacterium]|nr:protein translocase subunit SecF [Alphaproteobacteria bacterium]